MSRLRAKCPECKTYTAVAIGPDYECHSCGRVFHSGLVRVPQAWGDGGEAMAESAWLEVPFPEAGIVEAETLEEQNLALAADLPERPLVLGGDCCSHVGAIEGLSARQGRIALVWLDAHGDLNTPESSPSGNQWGMPLRMLLDSGAVEASDVALVGARNLDPPEEEFIRASGLHIGEEGVAQALDGVGCTYVALDVDVLEPSEMSVFMPEPGGPSRAEIERILGDVAGRTKVLRAGFTGLTFEPSNIEPLAEAEMKTGLGEAMVIGHASIEGTSCELAVMDFSFMGGSMGSVVGEKFSLACDSAAERGVPLVSVTASGGARMQEGILSLMQLPKTVCAVEDLHDSGQAMISVMTHPTTAGVLASFASLGDVIVAEPGALLAFTGPRVVQQTTREKLPEDFGLAEQNLRFGHIDAIVPRPELKPHLARLLRLFSPNGD